MRKKGSSVGEQVSDEAVCVRIIGVGATALSVGTIDNHHVYYYIAIELSQYITL